MNTVYQPAHFTTAIIGPTTEAVTVPGPEGPGAPWDRQPEALGEPQPFAATSSSLVVAAYAADGHVLPPGLLGYVCRVDSRGGITRMRPISGTFPNVVIPYPMRFVIEKIETPVPVGIDIDGFFSVGGVAE
jgi:hypothetical protein